MQERFLDLEISAITTVQLHLEMCPSSIIYLFSSFNLE